MGQFSELDIEKQEAIMQQETTKQSKKALTKKDPVPTDLSNLPADLAGDWGTEEVTGEDVIIPKLLLMHGQSELVQEGRANQGDIVKSTDGTVLAKKGEGVEVVPFMMYKTWINKELVDGQFEWRGEEPLTPANSDLEWEYEKNGTTWRRDRAYNYYALLVKDLEEGNFQLPIRLQFQRTSHKAGKQIANWFSECKMERKPPAIKSWIIASDLVKGEKHNYHIFKTEPGNSQVEHLATCKKWFMEITTTRDKYKDHNVEEEANNTVIEDNEEF